MDTNKGFGFAGGNATNYSIFKLTLSNFKFMIFLFSFVITNFRAPDYITCGGPLFPTNDRGREGRLYGRDQYKDQGHLNLHHSATGCCGAHSSDGMAMTSLSKNCFESSRLVGLEWRNIQISI